MVHSTPPWVEHNRAKGEQRLSLELSSFVQISQVVSRGEGATHLGMVGGFALGVEIETSGQLHYTI